MPHFRFLRAQWDRLSYRLCVEKMELVLVDAVVSCSAEGWRPGNKDEVS